MDNAGREKLAKQHQEERKEKAALKDAEARKPADAMRDAAVALLPDLERWGGRSYPRYIALREALLAYALKDGF